MKRLGRVCLWVAAAAFLPFASSAQSASSNRAAEVQKWRKDYAAELTQPDGWLTLVALQWLQPGETTVGSAPDNKLVLKHVPAHVGVVTLQDGAIRFRPAAGAGVKVNGAVAGDGALKADDAGTPSEIASGEVRMTIIHRGDRYYLRVKDAAAPSRTGFHGLSWYADDARYRIVAKWVPNATPKVLHIVNVLGQVRDEASPGYAEFQVDGHTVRLEPTGDDSGLFFVFRDTTAKTATYGAGRFLSTEAPSNGLHKPGTLLLDFNFAHNPPCGYTPYATCPLPTPENRLALAIPAGEKRYRE